MYLFQQRKDVAMANDSTQLALFQLADEAEKIALRSDMNENIQREAKYYACTKLMTDYFEVRVKASRERIIKELGTTSPNEGPFIIAQTPEVILTGTPRKGARRITRESLILAMRELGYSDSDARAVADAAEKRDKDTITLSYVLNSTAA
jgi:hypothetical protein